MESAEKIGGGKLVSVYLLSLLSVVLWGMSYLWSDRLLAIGIPVEYIVFVRIFIAGLVLLGVAVLTGKDIVMKKKDIPYFLLIAFFEPFIYFVCETYGIRFTESPTISALIIAATPIFSVMVGVLVFKEKFSIFNMLGILICLGGIVMVTFSAGGIGDKFIFGIILLVIAVLAEVGHASFTKVLASSYSPIVIVMYQFLIGALYLFPLFLTSGIKNFDASVYLSWEVWEPILCLAVLCSSLAFGLWANTIKCLGVAKSSIFLSAIPVFTALECWILGHEMLTPLQWTGIIVSCVGVVMSQYVFKKPLCHKK